MVMNLWPDMKRDRKGFEESASLMETVVDEFEGDPCHWMRLWE